MKQKKKRSAAKKSADVNVDHFTAAQSMATEKACLKLIGDINQLLPPLQTMEAKQRQASSGKALPSLLAPFTQLLDVLTIKENDKEADKVTKAALRKSFDASLGASDNGTDPEAFEVELLRNRITRIQVQQTIIATLDQLRRDLADDILITGEMVVGPLTAAIDLTRLIARQNPDYHRLLSRVLDSLGKMTAAARTASSTEGTDTQDTDASTSVNAPAPVVAATVPPVTTTAPKA